jgi:hypothetical protein
MSLKWIEADLSDSATAGATLDKILRIFEGYRDTVMGVTECPYSKGSDMERAWLRGKEMATADTDVPIVVERGWITPIPLREFQARMNSLNHMAQHGCGNGGCQIEKPKGMHTNAGCFCTPRRFSEELLWLAAEVEKHGRYRMWPKPPDTNAG